MKNISRLALLVSMGFLTLCARSESFEYTFEYSRDEVDMRVTPEGDAAIMLKGCKLAPTDPGDPLLPVKEFAIRVPEGEEIIDWTVEAGDSELVAENVLPVFAPRPHKTGGVDEDKYVPATRNEALYGLKTPYPAKRADLQHSGKMRGVTIATFRVSPVWFVGAEKTVYLTKSVTLKITTGAKRKLQAVEPAIPRSEIFENAINSMVVNPAPVQTSGRSLQSVPKAGSGCQYLVITTNVQAFVAAAQKLADFRKSFDHVTAEVVDLATISANSSWSATRPDGGTDMQTKIRNCIKWYVQNKGTEYVVLAGDDRVVPIREVSVRSDDRSYDDAPSDLYYSDLDGTWDEDKNGIYGERSKTDLDLYPDVIVGRLPMRTAAQLTTYVDKVINYEQTTTDDSDIVRKNLWLGYTLWDTLVHVQEQDNDKPNKWLSVNMHYVKVGDEYVSGTTNNVADTYTAKIQSMLPTERHYDGLMEFMDRPVGADANDAEVWCRRLHEMYFRSNANYRVSFGFGSATSWDRQTLGDYRLYGEKTSKYENTVHEVLDKGYHFCGLDTHGNYAYVAFGGDESYLNPGVYAPSYYASDAIRLTNRVDFIITEACITGGFDLDGNASNPAKRNAYDKESTNFAEGFLRAPGGSVAFVGCAREGFSYAMVDNAGMPSGWQDPYHFSGYFYFTDYMPEYSKDFVRGLWKKMCQERVEKFGPAFATSKAVYASECNDTFYHWLQLLTNLLGDPLLTVHTPPTRTEEPRDLSDHSLVTLLRDPSLELTSNSAKIHVAADGIILGETAEVKLEYSTASNFSGAQSVTVASNVKNLGEFSKTLTGLKPSTKYYVRGKMTVTPKSGSAATCTSPFSLSFTTLSGIVPPTGTVASSDVSYTTAKVTATLTDKGGEAANSDVTITLVVSKNSDYSSPVFNQTVTSGTAKSLTGLTANTKYYVKATFTGKTCGSSDATTTFTTEDEPPAPFVTLSAAMATVSADGTAATLAITVEDTNISGGTLKLLLNGVEKKSWTLAKGEFSQAVDVTPGSTNTFSFVASGSGVTESASGSFVTKIYIGWFDVRFGDSGFVAGTDWIANSTDKSGGKFTATEGTETELVKGAVNSVSVDGEVVYTPSHASETGADVKVEGSVQVSIRKTEPTVTGAKAAFYFASATKARVYGAGGWTDLVGTFTSGEWIDYVFEFDYSSESAPRVRYTIGSATSDWIAIAAATRNVQRVRINGGVFSDFAAGYYSLTGEEPIVLERPQFATDGSALAFGGAAGSETFSMTIANPVKGAYYTVFTSTTLEGTFTAEKASVLCDSSAATYTLTVDADTPAKFAKIVISTAPFAKDAPLPEK